MSWAQWLIAHFLRLFFFTDCVIVFEVFASESGFGNSEPRISVSKGNIPQLWNANCTIPTQIHLSWDGNPKHMTVTWSTVLSTATLIQYQRGPFEPGRRPYQTAGERTEFVDTGEAKRLQYIHRCVLTGLLPQTLYHYRVGDGCQWSQIFTFRSLNAGPQWSPRLAIFGDLGLENAQSLKRLRRSVMKGHIDMIIHVGDFGYDLRDDDGRVGDAFLRMIEPVAAWVPYQTVVGNHEYFSNFTHYKHRFSMPGSENGLFYRFTIGPATFVAFSTEFYFYVEFGVLQVKRQYTWLKNELKKINNLTQRTEIPWIITLGHRPMYCSNDDQDDCTLHESIIRTGNRTRRWQSLEKLFYKNGVDLCVWAHEHSYERLWPVYNRKVYNGSNPENPYENPKAPVHVISGSAGCKEKHDGFLNPEEWSAFRNNEYGYMEMHIRNKTHIDIKQISDEKGGATIDSFSLIKTRLNGFRYRTNSLVSDRIPVSNGRQ